MVKITVLLVVFCLTELVTCTSVEYVQSDVVTVDDILGDVTNGERRKRSYLPTKPWPDKIVPYVFDASVSELTRHKYRGFMQTIEKHTCLSFFEKATNDTDHKVKAPNTDGFLYIHYVHNKCYVSSVGYSSSGRRMSACEKPYQYVHEFGHVLGLDHEIERFDRIEYLSMLLDNAGDFYRPSQELASAAEQSQWKRCDFSPQSIMLQSRYAISRHEWPTYKVMYPNAGEISTRNLFYFFKEISIVHGCCGETTCESSKCSNEGYMGDFEGKCQCVCPPGLDPAKSCTNVIRSRRTIASWPSPSSLLAPEDGCPDSIFIEGSLKSEGDGSNSVSSPNSLKGTQSATVMQTHFCTKKSGNFAGKWGPGNYCFLNAGITCEDYGLLTATWTVNEKLYTGSDKLHNEAAFPTGSFAGDSSLYSFCCRNDGVEWNQLSLPNDQPLLLYKAAGYPCQNVEGMSVREEYFIFDQAGPSSSVYSQSRPDFEESSTDNLLTGRYCRLEPLDFACGGMHYLDDNNPQVTIMTTNYPKAYKANQDCNWAFTAPKGSSILVTCGHMDIGCGASLKIRKRMFGEAGVDALINEGDYMPPVLSIFNKMMLTFQSGQDSCSKTGFKCTASLASADKLPYATSRGTEYCGVMNYSVSETGFHECIPWSQVFENSPETFVSPDHKTTNHHCDFESNYCRNVAGDRLKPFCVTSLHEGNVTLQYCDVGQFIPAFDAVHGCADILSRDPDCSLSQTRSDCFKSCKIKNYISNFPAKETPAKDVKCSQPTLPLGTTNQNYNSAGYAVGTEIKIQCDGSGISRTFMCLSTGQWSTQQNFCEGCPSGYDEISGNCYKGVDLPMKGAEARKTCADDGTYLVWPESQYEFENVIIPFRDNDMKRPNSKIWFGMCPNKTHWFFDYDNCKTLVRGAYMWKNNNEYGIPTSSTKFMPWLMQRNAKVKNKLAKTREDSINSKARPICKTKITGGASGCNDKKSDCPKTLILHPKLSLLQYGAQYCPYTTGKCQPSTCDVPKPAKGVIASTTALSTGRFVTYACAGGFTPTGEGNKARACQRNGQLTGLELVCAESDQAVTQLAYYPMEDTVEASKKNEITTGPSVYMTVKRDSTVKACRAYCRESGNLKIQFWGPGGTPKNFKLQSEKTVSCIGGTVNTWHFNTAWHVLAGQFVGVYDLTGNLIPRHDCHGTKNIAAANYLRFHYVPGTAPSVGDVLQFSQSARCYVVMVDCLLVPDTYKGSQVKFNFRA